MIFMCDICHFIDVVYVDVYGIWNVQNPKEIILNRGNVAELFQI